MFSGARRVLKRFAEQLLDIDDTTPPASQMRMFEDYLGRFEFDTSTDDIAKFLGVLKKKHLVDDIVIATMNGGSIASVNGSGVTQAVSGAALFNYVKSELPASEAVLIKNSGSNTWDMLFTANKKLYILKASSDLSMVELRALSREIESFLAGRESS